PPLMGIIVQPIIGAASDKTWCRFGRRIPYLFIGAAAAVLVMCLLPNAGSFGMTVSTAMIFGLIALMFLDTSINMAMQPFKMLVGDMVNEKQKGLAYSIQSFLCNAGSLAGYLFPFIFALIGISNVAPEGVVPDSVIYSFYIGAAILILCVIYTTIKVKEMPPKEYAEYHGINEEEEKSEKTNMLKLLIKAPTAFWTVGLVQFFCWAAFMFMWTYTNGTVAANVFDAPVVERAGNWVLDTTSTQYQEAGNWVGVLFAVQAIGSVLWAIVIPRFKNLKTIYSLSLILGGVGFISTNFIHDPYAIFISFLLIGCAWAAMLALPFTILTNALTGGHMGTYLGLFNGTICLPQIIAAALGGLVLSLFPTAVGEAAPESYMLVLAGILLFVGAACVFVIKDRKE
ncbi:MAG: MFS transporter, partial [Bacteroidaceae bacterium]|nr:MFS transporter [Bacteroidaceae bacterium]